MSDGGGALSEEQLERLARYKRLPNVQDLENADAAIVGAPFDTAASFSNS
jgi:hypothetical protein